MNIQKPIKISTKEDGAKQLKRSRVDDGGAERDMDTSEVEAVQQTIGTLALESQEVVMRENCLFEKNDVMAGPEYRACQGK